MKRTHWFASPKFEKRPARLQLARRRSTRSYLFGFERLEARELLATVHWIGGSGDWSNGANWSNGIGPGPSDDAIIDVGGADVTITNSSGVRSVASVTLAETLRLTSGTLIVSGRVAGSGTLAVMGGTLQDATVALSNPIDGTSGTLNHVSIVGNLNVLTGDAFLTIRNGLTLNGTASLSAGDRLYFEGTQSLSGSGTVAFTDNAFYGSLIVNQNNTTLTIGPQITVRGGSTSNDFFSGTVIGRSDRWGGGTTGAHVVNQGKISADVAGQWLQVRTLGDFTNQGNLEAKNSGLLNVATLVGNLGSNVSLATGGSISLGGSYTIDRPVIVPNGSSLYLGGIPTLGDPEIIASTGNVYIAGLLDNTNKVLLQNSVTGSWTVLGGTIKGGTVQTSGNSRLLGSTSGGTLDGVTINGDLDVLSGDAYLSIRNGLTLNGTATLSAGDRLYFQGTQTLGGNGTVAFTNNAFYGSLIVNQNNTTLTIGPQITVRGGSTSNDFFSGTVIGRSDRWGGGTTGAHVVNQGKISADVAGQWLQVRTLGDFTNQGNLEAKNSGLLNVATLVGNLGSNVSLATGGSISLGGSYTIDRPMIVPNGTNLYLGGTPTLGDPEIIASTGNVYITGLLDNTNKVLLQNSVTGSWTVLGGTIKGGTVQTSGNSRLLGSTSGGTLDGVTINGDLDVLSGDAYLSIRNGLTLNGTATLSAGDRLYFEGTQTLGGNGTVVFTNNAFYGSLIVNQNNTTLTIGPRITVRGGSTSADFFNGTIIGRSDRWGGGTTGAVIVNQGKISADVNGQWLHVRTGAEFTNQGTIEATNGGVLNVANIQGNAGFLSPIVGSTVLLAGDYNLNQPISLSGAATMTLAGTWINNGGITTTNSTLNLAGIFLPTALGTISRSGGNINLLGVMDNTSNTLQLDNTGSWNIVGGTLKNGIVTSANGSSKLQGTTSGGTLEGVTINGDLDVLSGDAYLSIRNGLTLNGTATLSAGDRLYFEGTQTLGGNGTVAFTNNAFYGSLIVNQNNTTLTIGPQITVRGGSTSNDFFNGTVIGRSDRWGGGTTGAHVVNQGKISADVAGQWLQVRTLGDFTNQGNLEAKNSGLLNVATLVGNLGSNVSLATGGSISLGGSYTIDRPMIVPNGTNLYLGGTPTLGDPEIIASTGNVYITGLLDNTNKVLLQNSITGSWTVLGGTIKGGAVQTAGNSRLLGSTSGGTLDGVTINGNLDVLSGDAYLSIRNGLTLNGTATLSAGDRLYFEGTQTLGGNGTVAFTNNAFYGSLIVNQNNTTLTIGPQITVRGGSTSNDFYSGTVIGRSDRWGGGTTGAVIVNQGKISADVNGQWLHVRTGADFTNQGTVEAKNSGVLNIQPNHLSNFNGTTLTGGTWQVFANSTLRASMATPMSTNAAHIILDGNNSQFYRDNGTSDALSNLSANANSGALTLRNGRTFLPAGNFTNAGSIIIGEGSAFGRSPANVPAPTNGLIAYYPGEGNANDATGSHPGTLQGGLGFASGVSGQAFSMDGIDDSVDLGTWFNLNSYSIGLWVNPSATQQTYADIIDNNHTGSRGWVMQQDGGTTNRYIWGISDGNSGSIPLFNLMPDTWQHVLVTRDAITRVNRLYVNGTLVGSSTGAGNINYEGAQYFRLGRWGGGGRNWNGRMDEVRVYDRALGTSEASDLAAAFGSGTFTQTSGSILLQGGTLSTPTGPLTIQGGSLSGSGTIKGNVLNNAAISIGSNLGQLEITGNYTQTAVGVLNWELGGLSAGTQFDQLNIAGTSILDGVANVGFVNGFAPVNGDSFAIMNFNGRVGQFDAINGLPTTLRPNYSNSRLTLVSEQPGVRIDPTLGLQTTEAGGTASFTVVLDSQPQANVTIALTTSNPAEGTLSASQLIFTPQNWNERQIISITGIDDFVDDGHVAYTILTAPAQSSDPLYDGFDASDIQVTNLNDDAAGFAITPLTGPATTELGQSVSFTVALTSKPLADVSLTLYSNNTSEGTVFPSSLTFTPGNWNLPQAVTVTGVDDQLVDGEVGYFIVTNPANSADSKYNLLDAVDIGLTNRDNDLLDLQVSNLVMTPSTALQSGNNLVLNWKITNVGTVGTPGLFYDYVTIRNATTGETLVSNAPLIYDPNTVGNGSIQPGESRNRQYTFRIPDGTRGVGQIEVTITTDGRNDIREANPAGTAESNNTANATQFATLALAPDLRVVNISVLPSSPRSGDLIDVSWSDLNSGSGTVSRSFQDALVIKNLTTNQTLVSTVIPYEVSASGNGPISAGESRLRTFSFRLPDGTSGVGQLQFTITTDSALAIFESELGETAENNNTTSTTTSTTLAAYPDLQVTNFRIDPVTAINSGGIITIRWDNSNSGNGATNGAWSDAITIRNITTGEILVSSGTVAFDPMNSGGSIAPGTSRTRQYSYRLPEGNRGVGQFSVSVIADASNNLFEFNANGTAESNNTGSFSFSSTLAAYADLQVKDLTVTPSNGVSSGALMNIAWSDWNNGQLPVSAVWNDSITITNTTTGEVLGVINRTDNGENGPLSAGQSRARSIQYRLPDGLRGTGSIKVDVVADSANHVGEFNASGTGESNNSASTTFVSALGNYADLQVNNLTVTGPATLQSGHTISITWEDRNTGTTATAGSWNDRIEVVNTTTGQALASLLLPYDASLPVNGPIAAGASRFRQISYRLPDGNLSVGNIRVTVVADASDSIFEYNVSDTGEANNGADRNISVGLAPYPDLVVTGVTHSPVLMVGDPASVTVNWQVSNVGSSATGPTNWTDRIVASTDAIAGNSDDITLASFSRKIPLLQNQTYDRSETFLLPAAFQGRFHLFVRSNADEAVFENGLLNNNATESTLPFDVTRIPYADLVVTNTTASTTAKSGQTMIVDWTISNQGVGQTNSNTWTDSLLLASDPLGNNIIANLGLFGHSGHLAPGGSYNRSAEVTLPNGLNGTYYAVVQTSGPYEFIYTNNNRRVSGPIAVTLTSPPNLAAVSVTATEVANSGETITFSWTVRNEGPGLAKGGWLDYLTLREVGGPRVIELGGFSYSQDLPAGFSYSRTETFTLPTDYQGVFRAELTTNYGNTLFENGAYATNSVVGAKTLVITQSPRPDLQISVATGPTNSVSAGSTAAIDFTVINQGTVATATPRWTDSVYISLDNKLSSDDRFLASFENGSALAPAASYRTQSTPFVIPKDYRGDLFLVIVADANGQVNEFPNDGNNQYAVPIKVTPLPPPDLVMSNVIATNQAVDGNSITVKYTVTNKGAGPTDSADWIDAVWLGKSRQRPEPGRGDFLLLTAPHHGVLQVGESYEQTVKVALPKHIGGEFFITPFTNAFGTLPEDTFDNNVNSDDPNQLNGNNFKARPISILMTPPPDLVVTAVNAPTQVIAGGPLTVSWTVANLGTNPTEDAVWFDTVYVANSIDPTITGYRKERLGSFIHNGILAKNATYNNSATFELSPGLTASAVIVETNSTEFGGGPVTWEDIYSNNNSRTVASTIVTEFPDLQTSAVITTAPNFSGESTRVRWTVTNVGSHDTWQGTRYWYDAIYLSRDPVFDVNRATFLGEFLHSSTTPLLTNQSYTAEGDITLPEGVSGNFYVYVFADAGYRRHDGRGSPFVASGRIDGPMVGRGFYYEDHLWEGGAALENNNIAKGSLPVTYREADLIVSSLAVPATTIFSGSTILVSWAGKNQGSRTTRVDAWFDSVYLSMDASLNPGNPYLPDIRKGDIELGASTKRGVLAPNGTYNASASISLPEGIEGDFFIIVDMDHSNRVAEFQDEGNNQGYIALPVTLSTPPDLRVVSVSIPQHVITGQSFTVDYSVTNMGLGVTPASQQFWNDLVFLSADTNLDLSRDRFLGEIPHNGSLAAGASYHVSKQFRAPFDITTPMYVIVVTDPITDSRSPIGKVFELDLENNNDLASNQPLIIDRPPPADLRVDSVTIPQAAQTNSLVNVSWTVSNHGVNTANGSWTDSIYLSTDDQWSLDDTLLGRKLHTGSIAPNGQSYTENLAAVLPAIRDGVYRILVRTDLFDEVNEGSDESNNITASSGGVAVTVPALQLNVAELTSLSTDQQRLYRFDVGAGQTIRLSLTTSATNAANEIYVRFGDTPSPRVYDYSHSGPLQANQSLLIPGSAAGTYYVLVRGQSEPTANTPIQLVAEALPFQIADIVQDKGGDSRYVTATILGAQFNPNAIVKLIRPGFAEFSPVSYQVINSTKIVATFDLRNAPHGLYDVTVINPNGDQAHLPYRYLIEQAIAPDVVIGMGGTRVMYAGDTGRYGFSLVNATNVDLPYVDYKVGTVELGTNGEVFNLPYTVFSNNLRGEATLPDVPWASLDSTVNTTGENLAPGYALDLVNRAYAGFNFNVQTYPGLKEILLKDPEALEEKFPFAVGFIYHILAAATPLTPAEFVAQQRTYALTLRTRILADSQASISLKTLAADANAWADLFLESLRQAGILRNEDTPPTPQTDPILNSLMSVLAAGILAGPNGDDIIRGGNILQFFDKIHQWYGDTPGKIDPRFASAHTDLLPQASEYDLGTTSKTHFQAFPVYVRFQNKLGAYFPDQPGFQNATPLQLQRFLEGQAQSGSVYLQGPFGDGLDQFVPAGKPLPYTLQFENLATSSTYVNELRVVTKLDINLDLRTFRLGDMKLGDINVHIPDERGAFQGDFDFQQSKGFLLRVTAGIDLASATATWFFQAIDPRTGEVLQNSQMGFLAPNNANGIGAGYISWSAEAKSDLATGTVIRANGRVITNNAPPQETATTTHTVDSIAPTTTLTVSQLSANSNDYQVKWMATDDSGGSGVKHVTVYVSTDGGDYEIWQRQSTASEAVFNGTAGHTYTFLALATDHAGNQELPPLGTSAPDDGTTTNLGALPSVPSSSESDPPIAPPPVVIPPPNTLFLQTQQNLLANPPASNASEFQAVLRPFTVNAFATGIGDSHAGVGPMAILSLADGSILASGGAKRNLLYHVAKTGGSSVLPMATLPHPIFALAMDPLGRVWAATGGGPLLQLDPQTGSILGQFGDSITQAVVSDPVSGKIFVSSGNGIESFDPTTSEFKHFSDQRVGSLAIGPDGRLWGARWPARGSLLRFHEDGKAETMLQLNATVDSLAFGKAGTDYEGLLFVSSNSGQLFLIDVNTRQSLVLARGGTRGDIVTVGTDGRVFVSQSHQIDVLKPLVAPVVLSVNPPSGVTVPMPLASVSIAFDQDMLASDSSDAHSVLNPRNYRLTGDGIGSVTINSVAYDQTTRTASLSFDPLTAGQYQILVQTDLRSAEGLALAQPFSSDFAALADLSSALDIQFYQARSDRANGTISFDVRIKNTGNHRLLLPLILQLAPDSRFDGVPVGNFGRAADGSWLIDLSDKFPANGILKPGETTTGQTVSVKIPTRRPPDFDPSVSALPEANLLPSFLTHPVTNATKGSQYQYFASAFDENADDLSFLLVKAPDGMQIDPATGLITWIPTDRSTEFAEVVLRVYDSAGGYDSQSFTVQVAGVNRAPFFSTSADVAGTQGREIRFSASATDLEGDTLIFWAQNLPPGAIFDSASHTLIWTPGYSGTCATVTFFVSDGHQTVKQVIHFDIASASPDLLFQQPASVNTREGDPIQLQLIASDPSGLPITYTSDLLPSGASLDPVTGIFTWTPGFTQNGIYQIPVTVSNGQTSASRTLGVAVLNTNAAPVFQTLNTYHFLEGQSTQMRAQAIDPDNPDYEPPYRNSDGTLAQRESGVPTLTFSASGLPTGAVFDPQTQLLDWTPTFAQAGSYLVTFTATDDGNGTSVPASASHSVTLVVSNVNRSPKLTALSNKSLERNTVLDIPLMATDPDGNPIILTATGVPSFATFNQNNDGTGSFHFAPDVGDRGDYAITVRAVDNGDGNSSAALTDQFTFILEVTSANEPPALAWIGDKLAVVDTPIEFSLGASDLDQKPLTYSLTGLPVGATLTPSSTYGQATFRWTPNVVDIGSHQVTFRVTDDGNGNSAIRLFAEQTIHFVVRASNRAPTLNAIGNPTVAEGQTLTINLNANDPDDDVLTYSVANLPVGANFDPVNGVLHWTPNVFQRGIYSDITVSAGDGSASVSRNFTIHVSKSNQTPIFVPTANQSGRENAPVKFTLSANDFDGDALTFSASSPLPTGAKLNAATGEFTWTPTFEQQGLYVLHFAVSDGVATATRDVALEIIDVNRPPTLQAGSRSVLLGETLQFNLVGADPDANTVLTYDAVGLPAGATLNYTTGAFTWTPTVGQSGSHIVRFSVSDGLITTEQTSELRALVTRPAPTVHVEQTPSFPQVPGQVVQIQVVASSFSAIIERSLKINGQSVALDAQGRTSFLTTAPGHSLLEATVRDADGQVAHTTSVLKVRDPADTLAPTVSLDATLQGLQVSSATDITGQVSDANLDYWRLEMVPLGSDPSIASRVVTLAEGIDPISGKLAQLDPGAFSNGVYRLQLIAQDISGRATANEILLQINSSNKAARYARSDTDLTVHIGGVTLPLVRVYDSLSQDVDGTFGFGWRLLNRDTVVQTTVVPTGKESNGLYNPFQVGTRVYLNLPSGERAGFTFTPLKHQQLGVTWYTPAFTADPGVAYILKSGDTKLTRGRDGFYDLKTARPYHPASGLFGEWDYSLTATDGTTYRVDSTHGIEETVLPNGNHLYWSDSGVVSSTGESVRFVHDDAHRLTTIEGPDGSRVLYTYDANGNLASVQRTSSGLSSRYGYTGKLPHQLTLATDPHAQSGAYVHYGLTPVVQPIRSDLGGASQYLSQTKTDTIVAGTTNRYAFTMRTSELHSVPTDVVMMGVEIKATAGSTFSPAIPSIGGLTPLVQRLSAGRSFALFAVARDGLQLLEIQGNTTTTSGGFTIRIFVAGDANVDGAVDGLDAILVAAHGYSVASDGNGDGLVNATDLQLVASNTGFKANRAPVLTAASVMTHTDLRMQVDLEPQAVDNEGDAVYFQVVSATHGTATLNPDGHSVTFTPQSGFSGTASFVFEANDGYNTAVSQTITIPVSSAPLVKLDFQKRLIRLTPNSSQQAIMIGDFADQKGVVLDPTYVNFTSTTSSVASVSHTGRLQAGSNGSTMLIASTHGYQAATSVTVGIPQDAATQLLYTSGLDMYPLAVSLSSLGGTRQFLVNPFGDIDQATDLALGSSGTRYFVNRPGIINVSTDGLASAISEGDVSVTIINGPAEVTVPVRVQNPRDGVVSVGSEGGVVRGTDGSTVAIPPGVLTQPTDVSIVPVAQSALPFAIPNGFNFAGAFHVDFGPDGLPVPAQVALPISSSIPAGTPVYFFMPGEYTNDDGTTQPIWWQVESGKVDSDGMARTKSPPTPGIKDTTTYVVGYGQATLSQFRLDVAKDQLNEARRSLTAISIAVASAGGTLIGAMGTVQALAINALMAVPTTPKPTPVRIQTVPEVGLPATYIANVQLDPTRLTKFAASTTNGTLRIPKTLAPDAPAISALELLKPTTSEKKFKIRITARSNSAGESSFVARDENGRVTGNVDDQHVKVFFKLPNGKSTQGSIVQRSSQELVVEVPDGVILGVSQVYVHRYDEVRRALNNSNFPARSQLAESPLISNPAQLDPTGTYVFVALPEATFKEKGVEGQLAVLDGSKVDRSTDEQLIARIPLGPYSTKGYTPSGTPEDSPLPRDVAVTPDNTRAYVTLRGSGKVAVVDALTLQQINVNASPAVDSLDSKLPIRAAENGVKLDPDLNLQQFSKSVSIRGTVLLSSGQSWSVELLDWSTNETVLTTIPASRNTKASVDSDVLAVFDPSTRPNGYYRLRLTKYQADGISRISYDEIFIGVNANPVSKEIALDIGANPYGIAIDDEGRFAYVADARPRLIDRGDGKPKRGSVIYVIDIDPASPRFNTVIDRIKIVRHNADNDIPNTPFLEIAPTGLRDISISADGSKLYATAPNLFGSEILTKAEKEAVTIRSSFIPKIRSLSLYEQLPAT